MQAVYGNGRVEGVSGRSEMGSVQNDSELILVQQCRNVSAIIKEMIKYPLFRTVSL